MIPLYAIAIVALVLALLVLSGKISSIRKVLNLRQVLVSAGAIAALVSLVLAAPRLALMGVGGLVLGGLLFAALRRLPSGPGSHSTNPSGGASSVATEWLTATLDHETGAMDAQVIKGRFAGRSLHALNLDELDELLDELSQAGAHDSVQIVEAFLDQHHAGWRTHTGSDSNTRGGNGASRDEPVMTRARALDILGLAEGADDDEVVAAHRRLISAVHPDRGGSSYLASQLNRARDFLLEK